MKTVNCLSALFLGVLFFSSCGSNNNTRNIQEQEKASIKEYSIAGKHIIVSYPEMKAEINYRSDSTLHWKTSTLDNRVAEGDEKMNYKQVGDSLFFINWIEKDGMTVSQVVNFKNKKVTVFLSMHDESSDRGQRGSTFFEGKLSLRN